MRIAQIALLAESVPPKFYSGTERVVAWLVDKLVELGHEVTLFASGDSRMRGEQHAVWPRALRLGRLRVERPRRQWQERARQCDVRIKGSRNPRFRIPSEED